jgi:hypothetical protein
MMTGGLLVIVPLFFTAGIAGRRNIPNFMPSSAQAAPIESATPVWESANLWEKHEIQTRLLSPTGTETNFIIELTERDPIVRPDLLIYWSPADASIRDRLPANVILLGAWRTGTTRLSLTKSMRIPGRLILFSLGESEIVAVSKPISRAGR